MTSSYHHSATKSSPNDRKSKRSTRIPIYVRIVPYDQWFRTHVDLAATVADLKDDILTKAGIGPADPSFLLGADAPDHSNGSRRPSFRSIIDAATSAQQDLEAQSQLQYHPISSSHTHTASPPSATTGGGPTPAVIPATLPKTYIAKAPNPLNALFSSPSTSSAAHDRDNHSHTHDSLGLQLRSTTSATTFASRHFNHSSPLKHSQSALSHSHSPQLSSSTHTFVSGSYPLAGLRVTAVSRAQQHNAQANQHRSLSTSAPEDRASSPASNNPRGLLTKVTSERISSAIRGNNNNDINTSANKSATPGPSDESPPVSLGSSAKRPSLTPSVSSSHMSQASSTSKSGLNRTLSSSPGRGTNPLPQLADDHDRRSAYGQQYPPPISSSSGNSSNNATFLARLAHHRNVKSRASTSSLHQVINANSLDSAPPGATHPHGTVTSQSQHLLASSAYPEASTSSSSSPSRPSKSLSLDPISTVAKSHSSPKSASMPPVKLAASSPSHPRNLTQSGETGDGLDAYWLDYDEILARAAANASIADVDPAADDGSGILSGNEDAKRKEQEALLALQKRQEKIRQMATSTDSKGKAKQQNSDMRLSRDLSLSSGSNNSLGELESSTNPPGTTVTVYPVHQEQISEESNAAVNRSSSTDTDILPGAYSSADSNTSSHASAIAIPGVAQAPSRKKTSAESKTHSTSSGKDESSSSTASSPLASSANDDILMPLDTLQPNGSFSSSPVLLKTTSENNLWGTQLEEVLAQRGIVTDDQDRARKPTLERTRSGTVTATNMQPSASLASQDSLAAFEGSSGDALSGVDRNMALARSTIDENDTSFSSPASPPVDLYPPMPKDVGSPENPPPSPRQGEVPPESISGSHQQHSRPPVTPTLSHKRSLTSIRRIAGINTNEIAQFKASRHLLSNHYVLMSFSGGFALEEFSTIAGLKVRPYELIEVQLASRENPVRLPRYRELHLSSGSHAVGNEPVERCMWDQSYLEPYAHGWMYIFRPETSSSHASRSGMGTWKLRWFMLQGRTLNMYRSRPTRAQFAAAAVNPLTGKKDSDKRKDSHSHLLILSWQMDQVRWVGSERGEAGPRLTPPVLPSLLSQDILTVGFSRPPDRAGYGSSAPPTYDAGHTISLRCLSDHHTHSWYKHFQRAQYRAAVDSCGGLISVQDYEGQHDPYGGSAVQDNRGQRRRDWILGQVHQTTTDSASASHSHSHSRSPNRDPNIPRYPHSRTTTSSSNQSLSATVDLWRQKALSRSLIAGRGGIVMPGKASHQGGRNALSRARLRPGKWDKSWDNADTWSDESQDEDFLNVKPVSRR
ncbi:unnamed protein product [Sympodiomycopsis kandeliae]